MTLISAASLQSNSSSSSPPFHLLHNESTATHYSENYLEAVSHFFANFDSLFREYFSDAQARDEKKQEFQTRFRIYPDKIIDDRTQSEIPISSKQNELIRALNALFCYIFMEQKRGGDNEKSFKLNLKDKQTEITPAISLRQSTGTSQKQLLSLPNELLSIIFNFSVTDWQSVGRLALSCKTFYQLLQDPNHLHTLFTSSVHLFPSIHQPRIGHKLFVETQFHPSHFGFAHVDLKDHDLEVIAKQGSHLKHLILTGGQFSPKKFAYLLQNCPQLHSLEFHQCDSSRFNDYMTVVSLHATQLEHLKIIDCNMHDHALLALSMRAPQLRSFEYESNRGNRFLSDYGFISFFNRASQLESIKITGCLKVTQASLITYICKQLSHAPLQYHGLQLKSLKFSYCSVMDHTLFNTLVQFCPNLINLEFGFSHTQCSGNRNLKKNSLINIIKSCQHLRFLKLTDCSYLTSSAIKQFSSCPSLHIEILG